MKLPMKQLMKYRYITLGLALSLFSTASSGEQVGITTSKESLSKSYAGKVYSPYAKRNFPSRPLWGETHLHTGLFHGRGPVWQSAIA